MSASAPAAVRARVLAARSAMALRTGTAGDAPRPARKAVEAEGSAGQPRRASRAQARLGDPAGRETSERAAKAGPSSLAAHVARGDALLAGRLGKDAEAAYRRAATIDSRSAAAFTGLARSLAAQGQGAPALGCRKASRSTRLRRSPCAGPATSPGSFGQGSEAVAAVQQGVFLEPKNPLVRLTVGRVFEGRGQFAEAAGVYAEVGGLDPTWPAPPVAALSLLLRQGDTAAATAGLDALSEDAKSSGEAQLLLGRLLLRKEDWNGAKAALDKATAALPGVAEAQAAHGSAAYNVGELKLAADAYGRAVALEPENIAYLANYGLFLGYDGRLEEGLAILQKVMARPDGPTDAAAFINLGWLYRHCRPPRVAESVGAYEKALTLEPKNAKAAIGVALAYRAGGQWNRAVTAYERVSQVNPRLDGEAMLGTAWCYAAAVTTTRPFFAGLAAKAGVDGPAARPILGPARPPRPRQSADELYRLSLQLEESAGERALAAQRSPRPVGFLSRLLSAAGTCDRRARADRGGPRGMGCARDALPELTGRSRRVRARRPLGPCLRRGARDEARRLHRRRRRRSGSRLGSPPPQSHDPPLLCQVRLDQRHQPSRTRWKAEGASHVAVGGDRPRNGPQPFSTNSE
jgi:tetratricopeptide (TPR) repeat protein